VDLIKKNFEPNLHLSGKVIELVACGGAHTLIKTSMQEVYSFGLNDKGQLGLASIQEIVSVPSKIKNFTSFRVTVLACAGKTQIVNIPYRRILLCLD
jgi:alpha-tubulin suppressor-like RCC1 family protein